MATGKEVKVKAFYDMLAYTSTKDYKETLEAVIQQYILEVDNVSDNVAVLFELLEMFKTIDNEEREKPLQFIKEMGLNNDFKIWLKSKEI
jgi:hypothetical protein